MEDLRLPVDRGGAGGEDTHRTRHPQSGGPLPATIKEGEEVPAQVLIIVIAKFSDIAPTSTHNVQKTKEGEGQGTSGAGGRGGGGAGR